jgi:hypothetical protein
MIFLYGYFIWINPLYPMGYNTTEWDLMILIWSFPEMWVPLNHPF